MSVDDLLFPIKKVCLIAISILLYCLDVEIFVSVGGIVVSIAAFQAVDPGSIPGQRMYFLFCLCLFKVAWRCLIMLVLLYTCWKKVHINLPLASFTLHQCLSCLPSFPLCCHGYAIPMATAGLYRWPQAPLLRTLSNFIIYSFPAYRQITQVGSAESNTVSVTAFSSALHPFLL